MGLVRIPSQRILTFPPKHVVESVLYKGNGHLNLALNSSWPPRCLNDDRRNIHFAAGTAAAKIKPLGFLNLAHQRGGHPDEISRGSKL